MSLQCDIIIEKRLRATELLAQMPLKDVLGAVSMSPAYNDR